MKRYLVVFVLLYPTVSIADDLHELLVHKSPTCGCCVSWLSNLKSEGLTAEGKDVQYLEQVKIQFNIAPKYRSYHTAVTSNNKVFEGHVPAKFIKRFLSEDHPDAIGLSVPGMPLGSPGMEISPSAFFSRFRNTQETLL